MIADEGKQDSMSEHDSATELLYAAGKGDLGGIRNLIESGLSVNAMNHVGGTALMAACASYRVECVAFLLQAGASVNSMTHDGRTALHAAVGSSPSLPEQQRDCIRLLLDHGAVIDAQDASGLTALMNASWFGCILSVLTLLEYGASTKLVDHQNRSAKELALVKKRDDVVKAISEVEAK